MIKCKEGPNKECMYCESFLECYENKPIIITNDIKENAVENAASYTSSTYKEAVNHPSHYNGGQYEVIDVIEDWNLDFCKGNAIKYIARAGKKDKSKEIEDLQKAVWYLNREIKNLEEK